MDHIGAHLKQLIADKKAAAKDRRTERGELLKEFQVRLNAPRIRDGYPALTIARVGVLLQSIPTKDLYYLKKVCSDANDFSKKFWWEINPKNHPETREAALKTEREARKIQRKETGKAAQTRPKRTNRTQNHKKQDTNNTQ